METRPLRKRLLGSTLAAAVMIGLPGCGALGLAPPANTDCASWGVMAVSREECLVATSSGGCSRSTTSHTTVPICNRYVCKVGFVAPDEKPGNGCFAGDELKARRLVLGEKQLERARRYGNQGDADSHSPAFSPQGDKVAFVSASANFGGATLGHSNIFVKDLRSGALTRITNGLGGETPDGGSSTPRFSPDGSRLLFNSLAGNLVEGDDNRRNDVFQHDLRTGTTQRVTVDPTDASGGSISRGLVFSSDGERIAMYGFTSPTRPACSYVKDLRSQTATRITYPSSRGPACSFDAEFLPDGRLAFTGFGRNSNETIFLASSAGGPATEVLGDAWHNQNNGRKYSIGNITSAKSGGRIAFTRAEAPLGARVILDLYLLDVRSGRFSPVTTSRGFTGSPSFSADGNLLAFESDLADLVDGDTNGSADVFVKDLRTGAVRRVSTNAQGVQADGPSGGPQLSPDGTKLLFVSSATNLIPNDTNGVGDVFLKDLLTGAVVRVSVLADHGPLAQQGSTKH